MTGGPPAVLPPPISSLSPACIAPRRSRIRRKAMLPGYRSRYTLKSHPLLDKPCGRTSTAVPEVPPLVILT